ncbi:MAG TPA: hemerythrin domain-containing protein [Blastocatellia bacterium]
MIAVADRPSFMSLLKVHEDLKELFLSHQMALLALDIELAHERLLQFRREIEEHMHVEEELLLPVYNRAGRIPGGPVEFFTGEHKRLLEFLSRFDEQLTQMKSSSENPAREIIELFDGEAVFKSLLEHHDLREQNIFYPVLDEITTEQERQQLLSKC